MSAAHMGMVFAAAGLDGSEKLLLLGYTNYTDPHGYCWPSEERLADDCGTSRSTVQRAKRKLAARNLVKSVRRSNPKTGEPISNLTRVNLPLLASMARGKAEYDDNLIDAISFEDDSQDDPASTLEGTPDDPEPTSDLLKGHSDSYPESNRLVPRVNMTPTPGQSESQSLTDPLRDPTTVLPSAASNETAAPADGGTDGSGVVDGKDEKPAAAAPVLPTAPEGAAILLAVARLQPRLAVAGKVLADQALYLEGMLANGWTVEDLVLMLAVEPPAEMRSAGAILAARIKRIPDKPASLPRQDPAAAGSSWSEPKTSVAEALAFRGAKPSCVECGRIPMDGYDRCARCMDWPYCIACLPGPTRRRAHPDGDGLCTNCAASRNSYAADEAAWRELEGAL